MLLPILAMNPPTIVAANFGHTSWQRSLCESKNVETCHFTAPWSVDVRGIGRTYETWICWRFWYNTISKHTASGKRLSCGWSLWWSNCPWIAIENPMNHLTFWDLMSYFDRQPPYQWADRKQRDQIFISTSRENDNTSASPAFPPSCPKSEPRQVSMDTKTRKSKVFENKMHNIYIHIHIIIYIYTHIKRKRNFTNL